MTEALDAYGKVLETASYNLLEAHQSLIDLGLEAWREWRVFETGGPKAPKAVGLLSETWRLWVEKALLPNKRQ